MLVPGRIRPDGGASPRPQNTHWGRCMTQIPCRSVCCEGLPQHSAKKQTAAKVSHGSRRTGILPSGSPASKYSSGGGVSARAGANSAGRWRKPLASKHPLGDMYDTDSLPFGLLRRAAPALRKEATGSKSEPWKSPNGNFYLREPGLKILIGGWRKCS